MRPHDADAPDAPQLNRPLPDSVLSVLREEADLARRQRGETRAEPPADEPPALQAAAVVAVAAGPAPSRHINAQPHRPGQTLPPHETLEATVTRTTPHRTTVEPLHEAPPDDMPGYRRGLGLSAGIAAALLMIYLAAPGLAAQGALGARLMDYRAAIDDGRSWLHQQVFGTTGE